MRATGFDDVQFSELLRGLPSASATGVYVKHQPLSNRDSCDVLTCPTLHVVGMAEDSLWANVAHPLPVAFAGDIFLWLRQHANDLVHSRREYAAYVCGLAVVQRGETRTLIDHTGNVHVLGPDGSEYHGQPRQARFVEDGLTLVEKFLPLTPVAQPDAEVHRQAPLAFHTIDNRRDAIVPQKERA